MSNKTVMAQKMDNVTTEQVVPDVIDTVPQSIITVKYPSGVSVELGNELTPTLVKDEPSISWSVKSEQHLHTLVMVDPDAPSRKNPVLRQVLHYMVTNIPGTDLSKGVTNVGYLGSGPPANTGLHRYVYLVYEQPGKMESSLNTSKNSREGRVKFSIRDWAKEKGLGEPIAINFYQAQYDDYVPILHASLGGPPPKAE